MLTLIIIVAILNYIINTMRFKTQKSGDRFKVVDNNRINQNRIHQKQFFYTAYLLYILLVFVYIHMIIYVTDYNKNESKIANCEDKICFLEERLDRIDNYLKTMESETESSNYSPDAYMQLKEKRIELNNELGKYYRDLDALPTDGGAEARATKLKVYKFLMYFG